jgi:DNA-binding NtrC family response regulator
MASFSRYPPFTSTESSVRILLVDDNAFVREMLAELLRDAGLDVREVPTGDEALELLSTVTVDIVATGHRMPGSFDGRLLARAISEKFPNVPVLLMTGGLPAHVRGSPGVVWPEIVKPFRVEQLLKRIDEALASRTAALT